MKRNQLIALLLLLALIVLGYMYVRRGRTGAVLVDLVDMYPSAEARSSIAEKAIAFGVRDETLAGETRKAIYMVPTSRLTFKRIDVPEGGWLRVWLGLREEAWTQSTDGALFRLGVSDGRSYDELLKQHVDPLHNTSDRRWIPVTIDLSAYAGQQVDIVLNTNSSLPGRGDDNRFDFCVWGQPEIYVQR
jgi:hypothetical protein